jgi:cytochrome c peroxidase
MNKINFYSYALALMIIALICTILNLNSNRMGISSLDEKLKLAIKTHDLRSLKIRVYYPDKKFILGQALFFDPILSGNRNVSCASCHLLSKGLSDGKQISLPPPTDSLKNSTSKVNIEIDVRKRNTPDLWNRDALPVKSLFLDGRVEVLNSEKKIFRSPLGDSLPKEFQNALEVQSIFPIASESEMSGHFDDVSSKQLPVNHAEKRNDLVRKKIYSSDKAKIQDIHKNILERLLSKRSNPTLWQITYRKLFNEAYPNLSINQISIYHVGSALAHFEETAFAANNSRWDQYLDGKLSALSTKEKKGAIVFYGKGFCGSCHSGSLFSDFNFHNVGVISAPIITSSGQFEDLGRYLVTKRNDDMYRFRTPPLRNVTKSAPYFHDGSSLTLREAIVRHVNPLKIADEFREDGGVKMEQRHIQGISPIITTLQNLDNQEIDSIISFLSALESQSRDPTQIFPNSVPSGLDMGLK